MYDSTVKFSRPPAQCKVIVGTQAVQRLQDIVNELYCSAAFIITDKNVYRHYELYLKRLTRSMSCPANIYILPAGERTKSYSYQIKIHNWLLEQGADRESVIIGIGGGVICDISGFAAATFMRGVSHILVPTTLLAQVDAAIGGKNGINLPSAKNIIGTVKHPLAIIADPDFLNTLRSWHFKEGLSELVKIALVKSKSLGTLLDRFLSVKMKGNNELLLRIIEQGIKLKLDVVKHDPYEKGPRRILNFGHTTGHALEALGNYRAMPHGKAVALGMLVALRLSEKLCSLDPETAKWGESQIHKLYRLFPVAGISTDDVWRVIRSDKKRKGHKVQFVLLESYAKPVIHTVAAKEFRNAFSEAAGIVR